MSDFFIAEYLQNRRYAPDQPYSITSLPGREDAAGRLLQECGVDRAGVVARVQQEHLLEPDLVLRRQPPPLRLPSSLRRGRLALPRFPSR